MIIQTVQNIKVTFKPVKLGSLILSLFYKKSTFYKVFYYTVCSIIGYRKLPASFPRSS